MAGDFPDYQYPCLCCECHSGITYRFTHANTYAPLAPKTIKLLPQEFRLKLIDTASQLCNNGNIDQAVESARKLMELCGIEEGKIGEV